MEKKVNINVPVVFVHIGNIPVYLKNSINKAVSYGNKVYLLTNVSIAIDKVDVINVNTINQDEQLFKSFYQHMSTNSYDFEYMCIYRWFILKNFMMKYSINMALYLDSDVYLFDNASNILYNYPKFEVAYNVPEFQQDYYWAGSACCSFWSLNAISIFCNTIKSYYTTDKISVLQEKWSFHLKNNISGGICDMTFLYLFSSVKGFFNLGKVYNNSSFDFHNAIPDNYLRNEYEFKQGKTFQIPTKEIKFINGMPFCKNLISNELIKFYALTEYAKLLEFSKKQSLIKRIRHKLYVFKKRFCDLIKC